MQLNSLQLECQKLWADKSLSFGCIVLVWSNSQVDNFSWWYHNQYNVREEQYFYYIDEDLVFSNRNWVEDMCRDPRIRGIWSVDVDEQEAHILDIVWHPITYSRLCYLTMIWVENPYEECNWNNELWAELQKQFDNNPELYNQSILEWWDEINTLVRDFLLSIY